jgi:hypothetical protein
MSEDQNNIPKRRLVVSKPQVPAVLGVQVDVQGLLNEALSILQTEISSIKQSTKGGRRLTLAEGRVLNSYIKSLTEMSKEIRGRDDDADLANLSDEQLLELVGNLTNKPKLNGGTRD